MPSCRRCSTPPGTSISEPAEPGRSISTSEAARPLGGHSPCCARKGFARRSERTGGARSTGGPGTSCTSKATPTPSASWSRPESSTGATHRSSGPRAASSREAVVAARTFAARSSAAGRSRSGERRTSSSVRRRSRRRSSSATSRRKPTSRSASSSARATPLRMRRAGTRSSRSSPLQARPRRCSRSRSGPSSRRPAPRRIGWPMPTMRTSSGRAVRPKPSSRRRGNSERTGDSTGCHTRSGRRPASGCVTRRTRSASSPRAPTPRRARLRCTGACDGWRSSPGSERRPPMWRCPSSVRFSADSPREGRD